MYIEEKFGLESAKNFIDERFKKNITNTAPIVPERNSNANLESGNDVYYKGAHALHMLRYIIGKETLWASLKEYLQMPKELPDNQTSTDEFISLIEETPPEIITGQFELLATFSVSSKFGLRFIPSLLISV